MKHIALSLVRAVVVWAGVSALAFGIWIVWATSCCGPADFPYAYTVDHGLERLGWISHQEAERRIDEAWSLDVQWAVDQARLPLVASPVAIPFLAVYLSRRRTPAGIQPTVPSRRAR